MKPGNAGFSADHAGAAQIGNTAKTNQALKFFIAVTTRVKKLG
jgi:hypothetical protein